MNKLDWRIHSWKGTHLYLGDVLYYIPVSPWKFTVLPTHISFHSSKLSHFFLKLAIIIKESMNAHLNTIHLNPHYNQWYLPLLWSKGNWQERLNSYPVCNSRLTYFSPQVFILLQFSLVSCKVTSIGSHFNTVFWSYLKNRISMNAVSNIDASTQSKK